MPNTPNYSKVCQDLLKDLAPRTREIISRRFGFKSGERETLESIGESLNLTRERVRQIEAGGFSKIKQNLFWAFAYNVVMIPLAIAGFINPVFAEIAMAASSITVVTNANLLRNKKI
jgi:hypothetical protein